MVSQWRRSGRSAKLQSYWFLVVRMDAQDECAKGLSIEDVMRIRRQLKDKVLVEFVSGMMLDNYELFSQLQVKELSSPDAEQVKRANLANQIGNLASE